MIRKKMTRRQTIGILTIRAQAAFAELDKILASQGLTRMSDYELWGAGARLSHSEASALRMALSSVLTGETDGYNPDGAADDLIAGRTSISEVLARGM